MDTSKTAKAESVRILRRAFAGLGVDLAGYTDDQIERAGVLLFEAARAGAVNVDQAAAAVVAVMQAVPERGGQ